MADTPTEQDLKEAFDLLSAYDSLRRPKKPTTVSLVDENKPEGLVVIRDADGNPWMCMPREVYDEIRACFEGDSGPL